MNYSFLFILFFLITICIQVNSLTNQLISLVTKHQILKHLQNVTYSVLSVNHSEHSTHVLINTTSPLNNNSITELNFNYISTDIIQFIFKRHNVSTFELPFQEPFPYHKTKSNSNINYTDNLFLVTIQNDPFNFILKRKETNETLFSIDNTLINFYMSDNLSEISTYISSDNIYGLGQRTTSFKMHSGIYTFYNKDSPSKLDNGLGKNNNKYGSHPMYLLREQSGNYFINYLRNSMPMDIVLNTKNNLLTYISIGGVFDFTIFIGDKNPENVIKKYHSFLGGWAMPPFWSIGFHQSRWGYKNLAEITSILNKYDRGNIPLDAIWLDIDYMNHSHPCTWNEDRFNSIKFKEFLKKHKKKYVLLHEPVFGLNTETLVSELLTSNAYIRDPLNKDLPIMNKMWPGKSYYVDFFHPNVTTITNKCFDFLHEKTQFTGIWLDMNELVGFSNGKINSKEETLSCNISKFPYYPGKHPLEHKTICPNAIHYNNISHYYLHNYVGNQQSMLVRNYLANKFPNEYPFILTRANAPGIGKYSFIWSGDNEGNYTWYHWTLSEVFSMNLFGIPMNGADVGGFAGEITEELTAKWFQMGSLFPFFRVHRHHSHSDNDPFSQGKILYQTAKSCISFRYKILKYYYMLFMLQRNIGTIFRPLFFELYNDETTLNEYVINNYFLVGKDLLCIPNKNHLNKTEVLGYFPKGYNWFDLRTFTKIKRNGFNLIEVKLKKILGVFLKSGAMIFMNDLKGVKNSFDFKNKFNVVMAFHQIFNDVLFSQGTIPTIENYNNKKYIEFCMMNSCYFNVESVYYRKTKTIIVKFTAPKNFGEDFHFMQIKSLIMCFPHKDDLQIFEAYQLIIKKDKCFIGDKENMNKNDVEILSDNCVKLKIKNFQISKATYLIYVLNY